MKLSIVVMKDTAVQAFMAPQAVQHRNAMVRAVGDAMKNTENKADYVKHPEDFELYEVGTFDDQTGKLEAKEPELIVRLKDLVR